MRPAEKKIQVARLRRLIDRWLDPEHEGTAGTLTIHRGKGKGQVRIEADLTAPERLHVEASAERAAAALTALGLEVE